MTTSQITDSVMGLEPSQKTAIREVMENLFYRIGSPFITTSYAQDFHDLCCNFAMEQGYPMGTDRSIPSLRPFITTGVSLAYMAYGHIDEEARIFVALYATFLLYADDAFLRGNDNERLRVFAGRFIRREKQYDLVLDGMASFFQKIPDYYEPVLASIILTGALNLINSCTLEFQTQGMKPSLHAKGYPEFTRQMSGANEAFGVMVFPRNIPLQRYIQCIPDAAIFLGHGNDVLSFYKEEVAHETENYISVFAKCNGLQKMEGFVRLANDVAQAHGQVCKILEGDQEAYQAWQTFKDGYVRFHISAKRYLFDDLMN